MLAKDRYSYLGLFRTVSRSSQLYLTITIDILDYVTGIGNEIA